MSFSLPCLHLIQSASNAPHGQSPSNFQKDSFILVAQRNRYDDARCCPAETLARPQTDTRAKEGIVFY